MMEIKISKPEVKKDSSSKGVKLGPNLSFASTEAFNLLRTNLMFSLADNDKCKVVGVTSSFPNEGKTYNSANIAYSLAEAGNNVLLIDMDMRKPSLAKLFKLPGNPGLSNLLVGDTDSFNFQKLFDKSLFFLPSGTIPPNPSELIGSEKMRHLIDNLKTKFDYLVIDLPPVNTVADPIIISKAVDGLVLVVRHNKTHKTDVINAVRQLRFAKANILGFVYNDNGASGNSYYRRGKYYHSYKYGYGSYSYGYYGYAKEGKDKSKDN